ncbi:Non-specific serine/threonine protein kinase [Fusarium sp. LHS14.1]|nr:Non-specific serine/threonine protein kinase [Fusarium sp. LHS14.1]
MRNESQSKVIENNPIGNGLDAFRASFNLICEGADISCCPDALDELDQEGVASITLLQHYPNYPLDLRNLTLPLLVALQSHTVSGSLLTTTGRGALRGDLLRLISAAASDDFNFDRVKPLLKSALASEPDALIWNQAYDAVTESTPPPRPIASSLKQTPCLRNTSSFANSSEHRKYVDDVLKEELGSMYVGLRHFYNTYFGGVVGLDAVSEAFFNRCVEGSDPLFEDGWKGWPNNANQDNVLSWFADFSDKLAAFADSHGSISTHQHRRRPLAQPNKPIQGSTGERKLDVGFVKDTKAGKDSRCHWSQILVPGELKSNPSADKASMAWLDLGRYAREVLVAQDTRRFVLGFTICGSLMRVWAFDRLGGIASEQFDINKDGRQFVSTILGFLWMDKEQLGFDPTIMTANGERFIEVNRNGSTERIIIDKRMQRAPCIAGRATTCWKAHPEGQPEVLLVIKDSWQYPERDEGELLREATDKGVVNVARYYHHETVQIHGEDDDIRNNVRRGLDITQAANYHPGRPMRRSNVAPGTSRGDRGRASASRKRSSGQIGAPLPSSKRSCSVSPTKAASIVSNRIHRRLIVRDYGMPIYKASSRSALLAAFERCIEGHESLYRAGLLHRDVSINNLMINEDDDNPSWPAFVIDLDLAIRESREAASGAKGKTGTRAFMAIGALLGEQHSFMHDLESFFWVLFWVCIHYNGPDEKRVVQEFDKWNYVDMKELAKLKLGTVAKEGIFMATISDNFTQYYEPLIPLLNGLRKLVFPQDKPWEREDEKLYSRIREILRRDWEACSTDWRWAE